MDSATSQVPPRVRLWELGLVIALLCAMYLPRLGSYSLWDPWEAHYSEVARNMLADHDWVKMRWNTERFFSKPIFIFWMIASGMKLVGVGEDGGYSGEFISNGAFEWGVRL